MIEKIIKKFKKMNILASKNGDIPVSCIIVKNNKIIASAYNKKYKKNNPFAHAEILAIKIAAKKINSSNLLDCELYTTLKPCRMCEEVIKEAKIKKVYYILDNIKNVNNKIEYMKINDENKYFELELKKFFLNKR